MSITKRFFYPIRSFTCQDLLLKLEEIGFSYNIGEQKLDESKLIKDIASVEDEAGEGEFLIYAENKKYIEGIRESAMSGFVLVNELPNLSNAGGQKLWVAVDNPKYVFAYLAGIFHPGNDTSYIGVGDIGAGEKLISDSAQIGKNCVIGRGVVIGDNVIIGDNVRISHNSVIGADCVIGSDSDIGSNVVVRCCVMGAGVRILAGAVIGEVGFAFAHALDRAALFIPHIGGVRIGDGVMIGSNCAIDRGKLTDTILCDGVKLDNLVHIAHNVVVDSGSFLAAQVGLAGSCYVGRNVMFHGQSGVSHGVEIGDSSIIFGNSGVTKTFGANSRVMGTPARPFKEFVRSLYRGKRKG